MQVRTQILTNNGQIDINKLYNDYYIFVRNLLSLNIPEDEIMSDICFTVLTCSKNFDAKKGSFLSYLNKSLVNNFKRKIYAVKLRQATECQLIEEDIC